MIKANELRIGNYADRLYWNPNPGHEANEKEICKVVSVKQLTVNIELKNSKTIIAKYSLSNLFPIPLTPEILENCGFEKRINEMQIDGVEYILPIDSSSKDCLRDGTWFSSCGTFNGGIAVLCICRGNYFANNITELHQLQNLYFSLTGSELEVSLK